MAPELSVDLWDSFRDNNLDEAFARQADGNGFEFGRLVDADFKPRTVALSVSDSDDMLNVKS
eukprot:2439374-Lingulodinium_polyedra.AAC.1